MPDQDMVRVQSRDGKLWDIPRSRLPEVTSQGRAKLYIPSLNAPAASEFPTGSMQTHPGGPILNYRGLAPGAIQKAPGGPIMSGFQQEHPIRAIPPTILKSFGIDPSDVENAHSYADALKSGFGGAASDVGEGMLESFKAGPLAPAYFALQGIEGISKNIRSGSEQAYESYKNGDRYGLVEGLTQVASGIGQIAAAKAGEAGEGVKKVQANVGKGMVNNPLGDVLIRKPIAGAFDVGKNFEERAVKEHQEIVDTINREYEQKIQKEGQKTVEGEAEYRTKLEQARDDFSKKLAEIEKKKSDFQDPVERAKNRKIGDPAREEGTSVSARRINAQLRKKSFTTQPRSGPAYQRIAGMADQVATEDVPRLDRDVRVAQNNRWTAFRQAIGDLMVDWTPVQQAVVDAETNILQGSPENIAIFRNILREGVDPTLEKATVFRKTGGALEDVLNSKNLTEEGRARLIKQLGEEAQFEDRGGSGPAAKQNVQIPFEDARGYYTELGEKIAKARSLPGDVRRALKFVQDAADTKSIKPSIPKGQLSIYNALKSDWAQYMGDFYDSDGPLAKLKNSLNSDSRLNLITGSEGSNIIDALGRYARHNPKVVNLTGRIRSMMKQVEMLPTDAGAIPGRLEPPKLPEPPEATSLSERPKGPEPLDVTREKIEKLNKKAEEWSQLRPWQLRAKQIPLAIAERVIAELLSRPEIQRWIAGAKK